MASNRVSIPHTTFVQSELPWSLEDLSIFFSSLMRISSHQLVLVDPGQLQPSFLSLVCWRIPEYLPQRG